MHQASREVHDCRQDRVFHKQVETSHYISLVPYRKRDLTPIKPRIPELDTERFLVSCPEVTGNPAASDLFAQFV